ncbi:MAG: hypothetical protein IPG01_09665 [Chitinophagaceae bacterium]|nr:hypothetical protein [Chitinophagaceae bacterium]
MSANYHTKDYYSGGMVMPDRSFSYENYGFGYQGSLKNDEVKGSYNSYSTEFRELDPRINQWWSLDPKPLALWSPYVAMNDNPIWFNDPRGDIVRIHGFKEKRILRDLRRGLSVNKANNPYYFDNNHELQIDKNKMTSLSKEQKDILHNIDENIKDNVVFTIKKTAETEIIPGSTHTLSYYLGAATVPNLDVSKNFDLTGASGSTIYWTGKSAVLDDGMVVPAYVVLYHELGGHAYYNFTEKMILDRSLLITAKGLTIDYENKVRNLNKLGLRKYDNTHPDPLMGVPGLPFRISPIPQIDIPPLQKR